MKTITKDITKKDLLYKLQNNKNYREVSDELIKVVEQMDEETISEELMTYRKALNMASQFVGNKYNDKAKDYRKSNNDKEKVLGFLVRSPFINQFANQEFSDKYLDFFANDINNYLGNDEYEAVRDGLEASFSKVYFRITSYNELAKNIIDFRKKYENGYIVKDEAEEIKNLIPNLKSFDELQSLTEILYESSMASVNAKEEYNSINKELDKCKHNATNDVAFTENQYLKGKIAGNISFDELNGFLQKQLSEIALKDENSLNEFIEIMSDFRYINYSLNNRLMLYVQCYRNELSPGMIACETEWKEKGYEVPAKEKKNALQIVTANENNPIYYEKDEDGNFVRSTKTKSKAEIEELKEKVEAGEAIVRHYTKFIPRNVMYSIDQIVDAKTHQPLEEKDKPIAIQRFNSKAKISMEEKNLTTKLETLATKLGLNLTTEKMGGALGYVQSDNVGEKFNKLAINKDIVDNEKYVWTLTHEIAHHLLKHYERGEGRSSEIPKEYQLSHQDREVQAQLVSHLVASNYGLKQNLSFSASYIKAYGGDIDNEEGKARLFGNVKITLPLAEGIIELLDKSGNELDMDSFKKLTSIPVDYLTTDKKTGLPKVVSENYVNKIMNKNSTSQREREME